VSFKKYLENTVIVTGQQVQPEGIPLAGPKIDISQTQKTVWEIIERNGICFIKLNEMRLKEQLQQYGMIIKQGQINYNILNKKIQFCVEDLTGRISIEQLNKVEDILKFYEINNIRIEPELARFTISINPTLEIGGVNEKF